MRSFAFPLLLLLLLTWIVVVEGLMPSQVAVLQALYTSAGGANWHVNSGWTVDFAAWKDPCNTNVSLRFPVLSNLHCDGLGGVTGIDLGSNNLVGTLPANLFLELPSVITAEFQLNPGLTGSIPGLPAGSLMTNYFGHDCAFTGTIPPSIFTPLVNQLQFENNQLTGQLPAEVGQATSLWYLSVGQNKLNIGTLTSAILSCTQLTTLMLMSSGITGFPSNFGQMRSITYLDIQGNQLSGSIPSQLCELDQLSTLYIQDNSMLSGTIPTCFTNWTSTLTQLVISGTMMSGSIPEFIFDFSNLNELGLSGFTGPIPDLFHQTQRIATLILNGNGVEGESTYTGAFPSSIFSLKQLNSLSIQYTDLYGPSSASLWSGLPNIQTITIQSNKKMNMTFPEAVLKAWSNPIAFPNATRAIEISHVPMTGTFPNMHHDRPLNLSLTGGTSFQKTHLTGYIPNATLKWVPPALQPNLFADCNFLLYPVKPWMLPLTNGFTGLKYILDGLVGQSQFSMTGGELLTVKVGNYIDIPNAFACAFCISTNTTACQSDVNAMSAPERAANFAFQPSTMVSAGVLTCTTPRVAVNLGIPVYLFYVAPAYGSETEYYQVSTNYVTASFYNPKPLFASLEPDHGRIEGCTTVTALGSGFRNAPNMTLLLQNSVYGQYVWATSGVVVNDTAVTFVIPAANASLPNAKYAMPSNGSLAVSLYAAGNVNLPANGTTEYSFATTCDTPLVLCEGNFHDDEGCPTQLCRCFSEGICALNGTEYQCECDGGFTGSGCAQCRAGFFGSDCTACDCDHGTCDDGMSGSGNCACESAWLGKSCSISKWGLGFGIVFGLAAIAIAGFFIRRRLKQKTEDGEYESLNPLK